MTDPLQAEFDTVAAWTADVALDLGSDFLLPAGCRGSGTPASLRWFLDRLQVTATDRMLDCGAGVGGPAAFAAAETGVRPVLSEPEEGACRASRRLFGLPVVQAASALPFADSSFDVAWSLGVLCTVADQEQLLRELRRVLAPDGRLGLLVFVARSLPLSEAPEGNSFPTEESLRTLLTGIGLEIRDSASAADFSAAPALWTEQAHAVDAELERRHHDDPVWRLAARQSELIGGLLARGEIAGTLLSVRRA